MSSPTGPARSVLLRRLAVCGVATLLAAAACATPGGGAMEPRYVAVHNTLAAMGLVQVGPLQQGSLAEGREARVPLELGARCTTVLALGGTGVRDVDVNLLDADGKTVVHDETRDAQAVVRACPERAGRYVLVVKMAAGEGDFLVATWTGGDGATVATALATPAALPLGDGTCEAPHSLVTGTVSGSTRHGLSEHSAACVRSDSKEIVYRLDLARRQRVDLALEGSFDTVLYVRHEECADPDREIACNDDASSDGRGGSARGARSSRIEETLEAGTYFVFVDGFSDEPGTYRLKAELSDVPELADACRAAKPLTSSIAGTLDGAFDLAHASCGEGSRGRDEIYRFDVPQRSRVRVTERSTEFSPVVHVRKTCSDDRTELACADQGVGGNVAAVTALLDPGSYVAFADADEKDARGAYTIGVEIAPEQGTGVAGDACADAISVSGAERSITGDTFLAHDDLSGSCGGQGAGDVVYRLDVSRRSRVTARFDAQEGEHVAVLRRSCPDRASEIACGASLDATLDPGAYFIAVDGSKPGAAGRFSLQIQMRDVSAREAVCKSPQTIALGQKISGTTTGAGDRFSTSCAGREEAQASPDRVYKLTLAARTHVELLLATPTWDGVLALRKSCTDLPSQRSLRAAEVQCNNDHGDNRHARIDAVLDAGTYYVVVDGHLRGNEGAFTLEARAVK